MICQIRPGNRIASLVSPASAATQDGHRRCPYHAADTPQQTVREGFTPVIHRNRMHASRLSAQRDRGKTRESGCMNFPDRRTDRDPEKKKPLPQTRKRQCAMCITILIQSATTSHRCRLTGRSEVCQKERERLSGSAQVRRKGCISIPKTRF